MKYCGPIHPGNWQKFTQFDVFLHFAPFKIAFFEQISPFSAHSSTIPKKNFRAIRKNEKVGTALA